MQALRAGSNDHETQPANARGGLACINDKPLSPADAEVGVDEGNAALGWRFARLGRCGDCVKHAGQGHRQTSKAHRPMGRERLNCHDTHTPITRTTHVYILTEQQ